MAQRIETPGAKLEFGYWGIRGLGQPIRFLLAYAAAPFTEVRYGLNQDGSVVENEDSDWAGAKTDLKLAFPNLPWLIDTGGPTEVRLTQSNAVIRYLARRFELYGDSEAERATIDMLQDEAYDYRNWIIKTTYTSEADYPTTLAEFQATAVPRHLDGFERFLNERDTCTHFVGERICVVDFILYELIWQTSVMIPGSITTPRRPCLFEFIQAFETIPRISSYMTSEHYIERPINSESAAFK